ncbi:zf-DHHC-domain-containing protein [Obba rivulosa]|uniref:Palmitoyltransferase n=1 Tax=Obba rivulosa TaxID=1052685 RepID=A0A8E2DMB6_9APHY|nr:zf-DHHC-domain-containing protein [Obba rivulosa]
MAHDGRTNADRDHQCCGVVEEAAAKSRRRRDARREKPQPWVVRKLAVAMTLGIIGYTFYVYIGRFCVRMIDRDSGELGGRGMGIAFLVIFCILGLLMLWSYERVVLTSPGIATEHVQKSPQPVSNNPVPRWWESDDSASYLGGAEYETAPPPPQSSRSRSRRNTNGELPLAPPPPARISEKDSNRNGRGEANVGVTDVLPPVRTTHAAQTSDTPAASQPRNERRNTNKSHANANTTTNGSVSQPLPMRYTRRPSTVPQLRPEHRYCRRDGIVKPPRTHHCRACGTCVLRYDHHCPWVGQCVGARNYKYFMNFVQWAMIFCMWTFATLLSQLVKEGGNDGSNIDPQEIVIVALAALFTLFTFALFTSHMYLILLNQTTVESLSVRRMKEREKHVLGRMFAWYEFSALRKTKKQWDAEWGDPNTEGNIWWLGSRRKNWEAVMGHHVWEWFLPLGRSPADGLSYPVNPRFDEDGRWRPRREWPPELQ